jgi:hypothetical protein
VTIRDSRQAQTAEQSQKRGDQDVQTNSMDSQALLVSDFANRAQPPWQKARVGSKGPQHAQPLLIA